MARSSLAVVIPCHNEATTLGEVVRIAARQADVLVVDDRSTDDSCDVARTNGAKVLQAAAPGYDGALETGLRAALADGYLHAITLDADGEHDPALVATFRAALERGAPLVCGVRQEPQRFAEHIVGHVGQACFGVRDLLCGMKGYSRPVLQRHFDSGLPLLINMSPTVAWQRAGGRFEQITVTGTPRRDTPRFGRRLQANLAILRDFARVLGAARWSDTPSNPTGEALP